MHLEPAVLSPARGKLHVGEEGIAPVEDAVGGEVQHVVVRQRRSIACRVAGTEQQRGACAVQPADCLDLRASPGSRSLQGPSRARPGRPRTPVTSMSSSQAEADGAVARS